MYKVNGISDKNQLMSQHTLLVKRLAFHLRSKLPPGVDVDDLMQAGMIGLLDAVNRYEKIHGAQFETYAVQRIRGAMLDELRSSDWLPRSVRQNMRKIETAMTTLQQRLGRAPTEKQVAEHMGMSLAEYQEMLGISGGHQLVYFEDYQNAAGSDHFLDRHCVDQLSDPLNSLLNSGFRDALIEAIQALPEREKNLMGLYYEHEMNLKEIGVVMGVSESRVCQLHSQAVGHLRAMLGKQEWLG
jgi:RNA polymerase sigma factor for flagellar operon FliA